MAEDRTGEAQNDMAGVKGRAGVAIAAKLAFEGLTHSYGAVEAVRGVTLDVKPGEVICLLGPSGCGKTTLLRIAAGIERPQSGRVLINDSEMAGPRVFVPPERRGIGLMFQDYALFPHLSIAQNVMFGLKRMRRREAQEEARRALQRVGLEHYAEDYPHVLSGGEQQRVALARAIVPRPSVLLMDEPFSGLDKRLRDSVRDETVAVLRETRATCILVTHDPEEALRMADRIALMRSGRLAQVGSPHELYNQPVDLLAARFFSELNELPGIARSGAVTTPLGNVPCPAHIEGGMVDVGVRPQDLVIGPEGQGVAGRILQRRFMGEVDLIEVAVEGLDQPLKARLRGAPHAVPRRDVGVSICPEDALVFARDEAARRAA